MTLSPYTADALFLEFQQALAGRYSMERELGRGGMGIVYLARDVQLDRPVAIKLLPPALAERPSLRARFLREAQLAARLSHPHIVPIHAVHEIGRFVYFVMAYVEGETLADRVQSRGPLLAGDAARVLREVAWALGHAHAQGIVHRDVKPDNILLEAATGRALVADFGIAAANDGDDDAAHPACGTPEFVSPEQALGSPVDARSDLYALGVTAFHALTGRVPFTGTTAAEVLARQVRDPAPPLDTTGTPVPRRLARLVASLLAKDPAARPESADAVATQLGAAIERRRELPAALRAFVKRDGRLDGGGTLLALVGGATTGVVVAATAGMPAGLAVLFAGAIVGPPLFAVVAARRLLRLGFTHADLAPAFRSAAEDAREERHVQPRPIRRLLERGARAIARVAAAGSVLTGLVAFVPANADARSALGLLAGGAAVLAVAALVAWLALLQQRHDVDVAFWGRVWCGRIGQRAFAVARRLGATPVATRAMTHRATELSLGLAAESLFASLDAGTRASLGDVPGVLQALQLGAGRLRDELAAMPEDEMLDESLRAVRAQLAERLRETVGAMETIRLDLLRLHAGALSLERFTTQLEAAAVISADVSRVLEARQDVEAVLDLPHPVALTPA